MSVGVCKDCGAPLLWAKTLHGRSMPLNAEPDPAGNVFLGENGIAMVAGGEALALLRAEGSKVLHMPHHATCPAISAGKRRSKGVRA